MTQTEQSDSSSAADVNTAHGSTDNVPEARQGTGFWAVAQSVGAAMIGVQSRKNRERDFTEGKPLHFIIGGIIGTLIFLLVVWMLVQYLLATS